MKHDFQVTLDTLVKDELDGKAAAISGYDEMLWRIRTGYAVLLYGAVGIIAGLVNEKILTLGQPTVHAVSVLILGFSFFGALLDYSFMRSKLRVVDYRDRLVELACGKAASGAWPEDHTDILECLKNSGERKGRFDWSRRTGRIRPLMYYGGTCVFCILAIWFLLTAPAQPVEPSPTQSSAVAPVCESWAGLPALPFGRLHDGCASGYPVASA